MLNDKNHHPKQGSLYQLKTTKSGVIEIKYFRFCFIDEDQQIDSSSGWEDGYSMQTDDNKILIFVRDFDLINETKSANSGSFASTAARSFAGNIPNYWDDYETFLDQWAMLKCVPGFAFVAPNGRFIWVPKIEFDKYFEECKLEKEES